MAKKKIAAQTAASWTQHKAQVLRAIAKMGGSVPAECIPLIMLGYAAGYAEGIVDTTNHQPVHRCNRCGAIFVQPDSVEIRIDEGTGYSYDMIDICPICGSDDITHTEIQEEK